LAENTKKTVYFLGAGASKDSDFKLPCMKGFFREGDFKTESYPNLSKFIKSTFSEIPLKDLNLEEVITFLELGLDTFGTFGQHPEAYKFEARREFGEYVNSRLKVPCCGCQKHKKIFNTEIGGSNSQDSIITLNYDLVVDNTLHELSLKESKRNSEPLLSRMHRVVGQTLVLDGPIASIHPEDREVGHYLKLHGSVNWVYCSSNTCGNHQLFFVGSIGDESLTDAPGNLCNLCGSPLVRVIVPPTMQKTFSQFPKLGLLWSLAYRELNRADIIVIFGVSFALSDYYLRWLFKKAITEREKENRPVIFDIDIDGTIPTKIKEITGCEPKHYSTLDAYLTAQTET